MSLRAPRPGEPGFQDWQDLADAVDQAGILGAGVAANTPAARLAWLHSPASSNVDGYEWGIFRVKWENGRAVEVWQTNGDFSDLDAAMAGLNGGEE